MLLKQEVWNGKKFHDYSRQRMVARLFVCLFVIREFNGIGLDLEERSIHKDLQGNLYLNINHKQIIECQQIVYWYSKHSLLADYPSKVWWVLLHGYYWKSCEYPNPLSSTLHLYSQSILRITHQLIIPHLFRLIEAQLQNLFHILTV